MIILGITGSLQAASSNTDLLHLADRLAPPGWEVLMSVSVGDVPHFNPDLDHDPVPSAVVRLRKEILRADAVMIASPEYAHSFPGSLKNALDWIVGSGELYGKPVALLSAAPIEVRGQLGRAGLEQTLRAQGAHVVASATAVASTATDTVKAALRSLVNAATGISD